MNRRTTLSFATIFLLTAVVVAQKPVAELPRVQLDTTWNEPKGGKTWRAHGSEELTAALAKSAPGDVIVLDAGATYSGAFQLPPKENPEQKWIYVVSSEIAKLPAGKRVSPDDASSMAEIVTPSVAPVFQVNGGANHWRFAGIEMTSASAYVPAPKVSPNGYTYFLVGSQSHPVPLPDSITIDRCYIHGSPTQDVVTLVQGTASNYAVIDSYLSDGHAAGQDSQAFGAYDTPGPVKLVNNYLEAAGENVIFGGAGGNGNRGVPSDITITGNYLFKPLTWAQVGKTIPPANQWVEKNAFELKSAQRVLFDSNTIENVWAAGQLGYAVVLTVRSAQSGDFAVVNDVTITNNTLKNVVSFVNSLAADDQCGKAPYEKCQNPGSQARWNIANNLVLFYDPKEPGGNRNLGMAFGGGIDRVSQPGTVLPVVLKDVLFEGNTLTSAKSTPCWNSLFFSAGGNQPPPLKAATQNIWILNNTLCRQPTGSWGLQGTAGLTQYMGLPVPLNPRFTHNTMHLNGDKVQAWPPGNTLVP